MATSKYVLTSAQAKTVGGRPPWPNSASDDGAADSDIGLETVGENLGEGGELATVDENEEGEVSREMLIAMAELNPQKRHQHYNILWVIRKGCHSVRFSLQSPNRTASIYNNILPCHIF